MDAAVTHLVFGRRVEERSNSRTNERDFVYRVSEHAWVRVPEYTRSMTASIEIEHKLLELGWIRHVPPAGWRPGLSGTIVVALVHRDGRRVEATGPFELALCRAAVKAMSL